MPIAVTVVVENEAQFNAFWTRRARFADKMMFEIGREALGQVKDDIQDELRGQYYLAGGRRSWKRTVPIGRLAAGRPALVSYRRRWASAPPQLTADQARIQISAPAAGVHAGGTGLERSDRTTTVRATGDTARRMQGAIFRKTGGYVSRRTLAGRGLRIPSRPHANPDNPTTARKVEVIMARRFKGA